MNLLSNYKENQDVIVNSHNGLNIIRYKHLGVNWADQAVREARGLILDDFGNIVARPFDKFFNLNELVGREEYSPEIQGLSKADSGDIEVTNKLDGSLVIAYNYNGLKFASSGSLNGEHASLFNKVAKKLWSEDTYNRVEELTRKYTMMFEYTSPDNLIVLDYDEDKLRLIGMRDIVSGTNYPLSVAMSKTSDIDLDYAEILDIHTMEEVEQYIENTEGIEGVVVRFLETGKLVKVKTEEYFKSHRKMSEFRLATTELSKANKEYIERHMLTGEEGHLDDILSKYRGRAAFQEVLKDVDNLKNTLVSFSKELTIIAENYKELVPSIENVYNPKDVRGLELSLETGKKVSALLVLLVRTELSKFHSAQDDYKLVQDAINKTKSLRRLSVVIREEVGVVSNYPNKITPISFIYNVLNTEKMWRTFNTINI